jgi:hypothetical protein
MVAASLAMKLHPVVFTLLVIPNEKTKADR